MISLVFIWYFLTTPTDRLLCSLWVKDLPTQDALITACGTAALAPYRIDVVPLDGPGVACTLPGDSLAWLTEDCPLTAPLDHYRIRIVEPDYTEVVCSVTVDHAGPPSDEEILKRCGYDLLARVRSGQVIPKLVSTQEHQQEVNPVCAAPELATGLGIYDQAGSASDLWTDEPLTWLAGRLIWFGQIHPDCDGFSGLDPLTLTANWCGMAAARPMITDWQNQFDGDIFTAALAWHVPARLLKKMLMVESQFWPLWPGTDGEAGLMQVTPNGVDVLLRYDPELAPEYPSLPADQQFWMRYEIMGRLACIYCSLSDAIQRTRELIPLYARLLAAYRCRAVSMNAALAGIDAWRQAVIDYNGSAEYLGKVE